VPPTRRHRSPSVYALLLLSLITFAPIGSGTAAGADVAIPDLSRWESQMVSFGKKQCANLAKLTLTTGLANTYYDMTRVMYQIADYTGDSSWNSCAQTARNIYRDGYVLPNNGGVPGYWNFTTGLRMDYERTGDAVSSQAAILLSQHATYTADTTPLAWTVLTDRSREVAYAILSYINAEKLGQPRRARRQQLVDQAYGHLSQWFVTLSWKNANGTPNLTYSPSPFMAGLTAAALIEDWKQTRDSRLVPALKTAADWLWANAWNVGARAMWYRIDNLTNFAPDLSLLVAPIYAFLYAQTGDTKYRDEGDALFASGVEGAFLSGAKQFNQNYWWSFDYVTWRSGGAAAPPPPTTPPPPPTTSGGGSSSGQGLVAAYSFDEGTGTTVADSSGNGNTGTLNGAAWVANGKFGGALRFDGSSARVTINDSASLHLTTGMTLEAWVNPSSVGGWRDVIYKGNDNYFLEASSSRGAPAGGGTLGGADIVVYGPSVVPANTWTHLAVTYDGSTLRLYLNGNQVSSGSRTGALATSSNPLQIGGDSIFGQYFQGLIDDVRVYNRALSAAEVQQDMTTPVVAAASAPTPTGGLVAAYSFNEAAGTSVADVSGNGNTGTIIGATWTSEGQSNAGLSFDGASNMVVINGSASLNLSSAMTLEAWVYPTVSSPRWRDVIYRDKDVYYLEASSVSRVPAAGGTFASGPTYGRAALPVNAWTHLAVTYDRQTVRLYVNGVQVASRAETKAIATSSSPLYIGGDSTYGQYFQGIIDEVRIYDRALGAAEIQQDMNTPL
jgi:hypothetical protein